VCETYKSNWSTVIIRNTCCDVTFSHTTCTRKQPHRRAEQKASTNQTSLTQPISEKKRKNRKSDTFKAPAVANIPWNTIRDGSLKYVWKNAATNSFYPSRHYDVIENTYIVRLLQQYETILVLLACGCLQTKTTGDCSIMRV
jgi:hypothetical protein